MKFRLTLNKIIEIDTDKDWGGDLSTLDDALKKMEADPENPSPEELHDALRECMDDDLEGTIGELDISSDDFDIEVLQ